MPKSRRRTTSRRKSTKSRKKSTLQISLFNKIDIFRLFFLLILLGTLAFSFKFIDFSRITSVFAQGNTYYVSNSGNDANDGSKYAPIATFQKANTLLEPGDTLVVMAGTYTEQLKVTVNGTAEMPITITGQDTAQAVIDGQDRQVGAVDVLGQYVVVENLEVTNSGNMCVNLVGENSTVRGLTVHDCYGHGIYTDVANTVIDSNVVYDTNMENAARKMSSGWGSAIKVRVGGRNNVISNNTIYHNYGEGIAVTRGLGAVVSGNTLYDNYSINLYIDNSKDVIVEKNFAYCNTNTGFERNGNPAIAYAVGEEYYSGWGAQVENITFKNNIGAFCYKGFAWWGSDVGGGMKNVDVLYNTFWGSTSTAISIAYNSQNANNDIGNNIVYQPEGKIGWVENKSGINMFNNFWVNKSPDAWMNVAGIGDMTGDIRLASTPSRVDATSYRLSQYSPAIGKASDVASVIVDFENKQRRTVDTGTDIGAIEFVGDTVLVTPIPSPIPSPTVVPSPVPTKEPSPEPSPEVSPSPSPTVEPTKEPTPTPEPTTNHVPEIISGNSRVKTGNTFSISVEARDVDRGDELSINMSADAILGAKLTSCSQKWNSRKGGYETEECTVTGVATQKGVYNIVLSVNDNHGGSVTKAVTLTVR